MDKKHKLDALMYAAVLSNLSKAFYETQKSSELIESLKQKQQDPEFAFYQFDDDFNKDLLLLRIEAALADGDKPTFIALTEELKRYAV